MVRNLCIQLFPTPSPKKLCKKSSKLDHTDDTQWLMMGDLNEISNHNRKLPQHQGTRYVKFNKFIQEMGLLDLGYSRLQFTWLLI